MTIYLKGIGIMKIRADFNQNTSEDHVNNFNSETNSHLFVDKPGYSLDSPSPGQASDGGFGDALNVVPQHLQSK
jgi:hypothetical protein